MIILGIHEKGYCGHHDQLCDIKELSPIKEILTKYENIIRLEIKGEIDNVNKRISEL